VPDVLAPHFQLEPDGDQVDRVFVRLRRLTQRIPEIGVIVGSTTKQEGTVYDTDDDTERALDGPGRRVPLVEVALRPVRTKSRIVLVHPRDLEPVV
jgi:hypothetical protein